MKLKKKNILKAVVAFAVASAFIMPGAALITNDEMIFAGITIYVDDSNTAGPWNGTIDYPYQHIQDGIDNATDGDIIIVSAGTYNEVVNIYVNNLIVKSASGAEATTIVSNSAVAIVDFIGNEPGFELVENSTLDGFTVINGFMDGPYPVVVRFQHASGCIAKNNVITGPSTDTVPHMSGVVFSGEHNTGSNNVLENNTISNCWNGFVVFGPLADGNIIRNNTVKENSNGAWIEYETKNTVVQSNDIINNILMGIGIDEQYWLPSENIKINYNNIYGNGFGIKADYQSLLTSVDATNNYWGDVTGPYYPTTNPNGLGDNVSDNVEFVPWTGYYSWDVTIDVEEQNGFIGDTVIFGEKSDAFDIQDIYDAPKPDIPPLPYVYAWFDAGLSEPYDQLWEDYRDYPDDYESWDLYIKCNTTQPPLASVNLVVSWNTTDINATEYDHIRLYDAPDVLLADMKVMASYVFSAEFEYLYHFQIRCSMNVAPTACNEFYTTGEDVTLTVPSPGVLGNDEDIENAPLIALLESDASNGTLTLNADGSFEYIPSIGFSGDDSFTYRANDGIDNSSTPATVTITVLDCHHVQLQQYWNLMSLPISELMDKTQIIIRSGGMDYTWGEAVSGHIILDNLYDWNTTTQCYAVEVSTFKPGRAYWMWAYIDCEILVYSNDIGTGDITTIQLKWNIVGFPYDAPLVKENIIVNYEGVDYTWDESTTNDNPTGSPIVLKFLYKWDRTIQRYAYADSFDAGEGYWMYAYKECTLANPSV